jgi:hypothetical protein
VLARDLNDVTLNGLVNALNLGLADAADCPQQTTPILADLAGGGVAGAFVESHIVSLNAFGLYASNIQTNTGNKFKITCMRRADGFVYIVGDESFRNATDQLLGGLEAVRTLDYAAHRIARVPDAQLSTMSAWEFWNGTTWQSNVANATPMVDIYGQVIRGPAGISKAPGTHWLLAAHQYVDTHLSVYRSANPQGPWEMIARVPVPYAGVVVGGGSTAGLHTKIIEHLAAPPEHSIAMMTMTLLEPTATIPNLNIRRWTPQFVVIPWY